jgi:hypothetical protein
MVTPNPIKQEFVTLFSKRCHQKTVLDNSYNLREFLNNRNLNKVGKMNIGSNPEEQA